MGSSSSSTLRIEASDGVAVFDWLEQRTSCCGANGPDGGEGAKEVRIRIPWSGYGMRQRTERSGCAQ